MGIPVTGRISLSILTLLTFYGHAFTQTIDDRAMTLMKMVEIRPLVIRDTVSVVFGGDFMMHKAQIDNSFREGVHSFEGSFSPAVMDLIGDAGLAVGNMEFALGGVPYTGYPSFSAPETFPEYISSCGMDVFLLANNHILDKSAKGADRTVMHYRSMRDTCGIRFTGCETGPAEFDATNPLYLRLSGIKVAFINFTYGTNHSFSAAYPKVSRMTKENLSRLFGKARDDGAELIVALPHWGTEYSLKSSETQREWAGRIASLGADIIIGSHPHVVQEAGEIRTGSGKSVPVIYSLGNAISNMSAQNTRIGLFVRLRITRDNEGNAVILGPEYTYTWCTLPGRLTDRHMTVSVKEFEGRRDEWEMPYDYDCMMSTYMHVKKTTGIQD